MSQTEPDAPAATVSDREQEDIALMLLNAIPKLEWIDAGTLAVNYGDTFESVEAARETLARLETQGLAERTDGPEGPSWRATQRGVREAVESGA